MILPPAFLGIPYVNRGASFEGCDCWGLVCLFHQEVLGRRLTGPSYDDAESPGISAVIRQGWVQWRQISLGEAARGDVLALKVANDPVHCGVVLDRQSMLHILEGRNSCIESYRAGFWSNRIVRVGRWTS